MTELHARTWVVVVVVAALITAHAALLGFAFRGHLWLALLPVLLAVVYLKHRWLTRRR